METRVHTPQQVFNMPQRLLVPLFQRPYVWNEENQWAPLWADVTRVAGRRLKSPEKKQFAHFMGAVVLQQVAGVVGAMQQWTVIDGQQRLTTLQVMLDALHAELEVVGALQPARRIETLVMNSDAYWTRPEDRFKVWPTNRDRAAFNEVMAAPPPVDYSNLQFREEKIVQAHQFFAEQARTWLQNDGPEQVEARAIALEQSVRELLQVVVIELTSDENAQEIFETLNARGSQLTAADLIKNFVFQRLVESGADVEAAYEKYWREFETAFWETEVGAGRIRYSRSSLFLNHWLIARTGEEIVAREVFSRFKQYVDDDAGRSMVVLVAEIAAASKVYRNFVESASNFESSISEVGLFAYRSNVLESEVIKPIVLYLLDPNLAVVPQEQINSGLAALESWLVRRMLIRATTKSYTQIVAELITQLLKKDRSEAGDVIVSFLKNQGVQSRYWPDDNEVQTELRSELVYRKLRRPRLRMVLEAIEDHRRGWVKGQEGFGGARVLRGKYAIEHVMPQQWSKKWSLGAGTTEVERDRLIHTIGNLTLLTSRLNSGVSNGNWQEKSDGLRQHDVLKLNRDLLEKGSSGWDHDLIRDRSEELIRDILSIWPVPEGHTSSFARTEELPRHKIVVADLIGADLLQPGQLLIPSQKSVEHRIATVMGDGRLEVDGQFFSSPSGAASFIAGANRNGWWFFYVDKLSRKRLSELWHEYVDMTSTVVDSDEVDEANDGDEEDAD